MKATILRFTIGAALFFVGVALLLDALGIVDTSLLLQTWWPLLIILAGAAMLVSDSKNYLWALVVITIGIFTQLRVFGYYTDINLWQVLWPLILIGIGASIAIGKTALPRTRTERDGEDTVAILGGSDQKYVTDNYTGGKVTAVMGGAKIDLRKAKLKKEATVEVFALMGGVELIVPRNISVKDQTNVIMGGVENKTDQDLTKNSPVLTVVGDVILGGIEIKN